VISAGRCPSSIEILRHVATIAAQKNARVVNVDATLLAEAPKISPHVPAMQEKIAAALGIRSDALSIKATTNEGSEQSGVAKE